MTRSSHTAQAHVAYDDALEVLGADPTQLFAAASERAVDDARDMLDTLRYEVRGAALARDIVIHVGPLVPGAMLRATVPLRWRSVEAASLFPRVDATLAIGPSPGDLGRTSLTLEADRRPPLGAAGTAFDRVFGDRLADGVLQGFVTGLARRLEQLVAEADLSSDLRPARPVPITIDTAAAVEFSPDAAPRVVVHADADHEVHVLGLEPWQAAPLAEAGAGVTVAVLAGHVAVEGDGGSIDLRGGEVAVVPAGSRAVLRAGGQRVTALVVEVHVRPEARTHATSSPAVVSGRRR